MYWEIIAQHFDRNQLVTVNSLQNLGECCWPIAGGLKLAAKSVSVASKRGCQLPRMSKSGTTAEVDATTGAHHSAASGSNSICS